MKDRLSFCMTNKTHYHYYLKIFMNDTLMIERVKRIDNCRKNNSELSITLDRMYLLVPYMSEAILIIMIRLIKKTINRSKDINVIIHYTYDGWITTKMDNLACTDYIEYSDSCEYLWIMPLNSDEEIEFATAVVTKDKTTWDNNNGSNYHYSPSMIANYYYIDPHHVPDRNPLIDFCMCHQRYHINYRPPKLYESIKISLYNE
jgi:hypothetical protein